MMNVALLAAVTLLIFGEKTLPYGDRLTWVIAGALILYGSAVLIAPDLLPMQSTHSSMAM
jgi:predicted metal-binding membrane protein